jgi:SAM-dependent methyltransferase
MTNSAADKNALNKQSQHWEKALSSQADMFGASPSDAAIQAAETFKNNNKTNILELGGGQGRDTIFFAQNGYCVHVLDYSQSGIASITQKAASMGLSRLITAEYHDVRTPLPFDDESFDGCFSHMLYCMALTTEELEFLTSELRRVLKPGGLNIYTVRHTGDVHYGTGIHRGEDMYEVGGFVVHFFSREKIKQLSKGFEIAGIDEFEEGPLPRRLFRVTLRKL